MADRFRTALDWESVRFFLALARHGSLSAAARALGVTHATVSRRVAGLEEAFGEPLFVRRPGGFVLTVTGHAALAAAGRMEAAAGGLCGGGPADLLRGHVRISATHSLTESFLLRALTPLRASHPGLDLELISDRRSLSLARHEADIALRLARPEDGEMIARRLTGIGFGFYGTPAWVARIADGAALVLIGFDAGGAHLPEAVWMGRAFPGARIALRASSQLAQVQAAEEGWGIALLPHFLVGPESGLSPVGLGAQPIARDLWLLTRRDAGVQPGVKEAADFLLHLFRAARSRFEGPANEGDG